MFANIVTKCVTDTAVQGFSSFVKTYFHLKIFFALESTSFVLTMVLISFAGAQCRFLFKMVTFCEHKVFQHRNYF